jgi:hypothetical protein
MRDQNNSKKPKTKDPTATLHRGGVFGFSVGLFAFFECICIMLPSQLCPPSLFSAVP